MYKCRICNTNEVDHPGDICELCAIQQDPYASGGAPDPYVQPVSQPEPWQQTTVSPSPRRNNRKILLQGGNELANRDPYGNDMTPYQEEPVQQVQVYQAGQSGIQQTSAYAQQSNPAPAQSKPDRNGPLAVGIVKNVNTDTEENPFFTKLFRSLFHGSPFPHDPELTTFQVFPDFTGSALNAQGNACDQVILYGKINKGVISENNDVEVYGYRDSSNNIIVSYVRNKASGTMITPTGATSATTVRVLVMMILGIIIGIFTGAGVTGTLLIALGMMLLVAVPGIIRRFTSKSSSTSST